MSRYLHYTNKIEPFTSNNEERTLCGLMVGSALKHQGNFRLSGAGGIRIVSEYLCREEVSCPACKRILRKALHTH